MRTRIYCGVAGEDGQPFPYADFVVVGCRALWKSTGVKSLAYGRQRAATTARRLAAGTIYRAPSEMTLRASPSQLRTS